MKVTESVVQVATKLKKATTGLNKRAKKNGCDLTKLQKNVEALGARIKQAKRQKRRVKQEVENPATTAPFPRAPTPMVNSESQWFRMPESPCIPRVVSPTPRAQYVSPMYASRSYMR